MILIFSKSNFFTKKINREENWVPNNIPTCDNSASYEEILYETYLLLLWNRFLTSLFATTWWNTRKLSRIQKILPKTKVWKQIVRKIDCVLLKFSPHPSWLQMLLNKKELLQTCLRFLCCYLLLEMHLCTGLFTLSINTVFFISL